MTKPFQQQQTEEKAKVDFNASKDASQAELLRIMKQQAGSDEDRWKILDARDKYLKLKLRGKSYSFSKFLKLKLKV